MDKNYDFASTEPIITVRAVFLCRSGLYFRRAAQTAAIKALPPR